MKINRAYYFAIPAYVAIWIIIPMGCVKNSELRHAKLPAATFEGKNSFGCLVDGEVWIPFVPCTSGFGRRGSAIHSDFSRLTADSSQGFNFELEGYCKKAKTSHFRIRLHSSTFPSPGILHTGNIIDSLEISYQQEENGDDFRPLEYVVDNSSRHFNVTFLDSIKNVIAGNFAFTLYTRTPGGAAFDSVVVSNGRFDFQLATYDHCDEASYVLFP